jgi:hypothetical protein
MADWPTVDEWNAFMNKVNEARNLSLEEIELLNSEYKEENKGKRYLSGKYSLKQVMAAIVAKPYPTLSYDYGIVFSDVENVMIGVGLWRAGEARGTVRGGRRKQTRNRHNRSNRHNKKRNTRRR